MCSGTARTTKPSGIPWLGEVPAHWEVKRLKDVADVRFSNVDKKTEDGEVPVKLCNYTDVYYGHYLDGSPEYMEASATASEIARFKLRKGDVLITKDSESPTDIAIAAMVVEDVPDLVCGYHLAMIRVDREQLDPAFLYWQLLSGQVREQYYPLANGITRFALGHGDITGGNFIVPPLPEQRTIAAFLDERTARIDGLIARKQRLVQLLKEKRQALITRAVTRGLDAKVKLKESGVPWLGEVPEAWEVKRLKHISEFITSGSRGWAEHYADEGAVFIRIGNLDRTSIDLRLDDIQRVDPPTSAEVIRTRALPGDLLISITAFLGTIGLVPDGLGDAYVNQHTALIRLQHPVCHPRFVAYWFSSRAAQQQFESASQGGTKEGMNLQEVRDLITLQPNYEEQNRIADALDKSLGKIDALLTKVEQAVLRLQEYRTALISAAVTGKVRVPQ